MSPRKIKGLPQKLNLCGNSFAAAHITAKIAQVNGCKNMDRKIKIMVSGIPGKMSSLMAQHIIDSDMFDLIPFSFTGQEIEEVSFCVKDFSISLIKPDARQNIICDIKKIYSDFIAVDFTHPSAVKSNVEFYCKNDIPFVMGTTGGDRDKLNEIVEKSNISAVIAPNMAKQIVGFQAMIQYAADNFPGMFKGYSLEIKESHQQAKADVSGTAKSMLKYFNGLGIDFKETDIKKVRDPEIQKNDLRVPQEYLSGHAWHTYSMRSKEKDVFFRFKHNVNGRNIYVQGAFDAVCYLNKKVEEGIKGKFFTMTDVLRK